MSSHRSKRYTAAAKQVEVVKRIANMEQTNPEVIKEVERGLEHRLSAMITQTFEKAGGVDTVAEMLNLADRATEKSIMEGLEAEDPDLVEQIRRLMPYGRCESLPMGSILFDEGQTEIDFFVVLAGMVERKVAAGVGDLLRDGDYLRGVNGITL